MKNIIFIAAPASGKGTISNMLVEKCDYIHISTGDLLRQVANQDTDLGNKIASILKTGDLVDDELINMIVEDKINSLDKDKPFILDGIPRTIEQVEFLNNLFKKLNINNYKVIYLNLDKEISLKRAIGRLSCLKCGSTYNKFFDEYKPKIENVCDKCSNDLIQRTDDNEESFKERYENFSSNTLPILSYYQKENKVLELETSNFTTEEIFDIIYKAVI